MADSQNVSSFPQPPMQYVTMYSDDNIRRGRSPQPPPPIKDSYMMFGTPFHSDDSIIRPLELQGLRRLHPHNYDHKREMKKLNHSLLVNFLDLIDILVRAPNSPRRQEKLDDLNLIFIHLHHLINELRPHQARESLRVILEHQKRQRLEIAEHFHKRLDRVHELLQAAVSSLPDEESGDSKLLTRCNIHLASRCEPPTDDDTEQCDTLDKMMCEIIDTMNN